MTTTETTARTAEISHDARLYELLSAEAAAYAALHAAADRVLKAATEGHRGSTAQGDSFDLRDSIGRSISTTYADAPDGTIFFQGKTWTRGEEGYYAVEGSGRRRATIADALDRIASGAVEDRHGRAAAYHAAQDEVASIQAEIAAHEENYTGWTRYFLVTSSAGHVHDGMSCSTCRPSTTYAPVVSLSAAPADEAIETLGETLCSVCYPDAPVEGPSKITKAQAKKILAAQS